MRLLLLLRDLKKGFKEVALVLWIIMIAVIIISGYFKIAVGVVAVSCVLVFISGYMKEKDNIDSEKK